MLLNSDRTLGLVLGREGDAGCNALSSGKHCWKAQGTKVRPVRWLGNQRAAPHFASRLYLVRFYASLFLRFTTTNPSKSPAKTTSEMERGSGTGLAALITKLPEDVVV